MPTTVVWPCCTAAGVTATVLAPGSSPTEAEPPVWLPNWSVTE